MGNVWTEMSYSLYNDRKTEYCEETNNNGFYETIDGYKIFLYGLYENLSMCCCYGVEQVYAEMEW